MLSHRSAGEGDGHPLCPTLLRVRGERHVEQDRRLSTVIRLLLDMPPDTGALLVPYCHCPPVVWNAELTDETGLPTADRGGVCTLTAGMTSAWRCSGGAWLDPPVRGS